MSNEITLRELVSILTADADCNQLDGARQWARDACVAVCCPWSGDGSPRAARPEQRFVEHCMSNMFRLLNGCFASFDLELNIDLHDESQGSNAFGRDGLVERRYWLSRYEAAFSGADIDEIQRFLTGYWFVHWWEEL